MKVESVAAEILARLQELGRGSRQGHRPSAQRDFGVYTPDLRAVVRIYNKALKSEDGESVYRLAMALLAQNVTESRQVAYELVAGHQQARDLLNVRRIEALGRGIDNWACVDSFCCNLVGRAWRDGRISDTTISRWARSRDIWWRRAAVVATVPLNMKSRGGSGDTERTLEVCKSLAGDPEVMVQKAISWALRVLIPWDRDAVTEFLASQDNELSARVKREVRRKLETGKKN